MFRRRRITGAGRAILAAALLLGLWGGITASGQTDRQIADKLRIEPQQVERLSKELGLSRTVLDRMRREDLPRAIQRIEHPDLP
jgi:hypothetical protein